MFIIHDVSLKQILVEIHGFSVLFVVWNWKIDFPHLKALNLNLGGTVIKEKHF